MKIKNIHFTGIKGVGMAPLAIIAKEAGFNVTGSDIDKEFITDESLKKSGITPFIDFSEEHVAGCDLVVITGAHGGFDNVEAQAAKRRGIPVWTQGEAVGKFMNGELLGVENSYGISVTGTHGKTTTTGMIATILNEAGYDPSFLIGTSSLPSLPDSGHFGKGKYFVAEADEYVTEPKADKTPKLLWQNPKMAVITNIDYDHPDVYSSVDEIREVFLKFANKLPSDGILITNGDDNQVKLLLNNFKGNFITFGFSESNDYKIKKISFSNSQTFFWIEGRGADLGEFTLNVLGEHNAFNALAAIIACLELGVSVEKIKKGITQFKGSKRRAEFIGNLESGAFLFDDYAHHPAEIKKSLKAFRESFPKSRIICFFQPHTYSRTKKLFDEFLYAFSDASEVVIIDIFASEREAIDPTTSSQNLVQSMAKLHSNVRFLPGLTDVVEYIDQKGYGANSVIITMGAGDIYKIADSLKLKHEN
jgi:UDP-N-acetylmuramate--alanine ligase